MKSVQNNTFITNPALHFSLPPRCKPYVVPKRQYGITVLRCVKSPKRADHYPTVVTEPASHLN